VNDWVVIILDISDFLAVILTAPIDTITVCMIRAWRWWKSRLWHLFQFLSRMLLYWLLLLLLSLWWWWYLWVDHTWISHGLSSCFAWQHSTFRYLQLFDLSIITEAASKLFLFLLAPLPVERLRHEHDSVGTWVTFTLTFIAWRTPTFIIFILLAALIQHGRASWRTTAIFSDFTFLFREWRCLLIRKITFVSAHI